MTGREDRFRELVDAHGRTALAYLTRRCSPTEDAADVLQAVLLTVWRKFDQLPEDADPVPWLIGVARNELANHQRANHRRLAAVARLRGTLLEITSAAAEDPRASRLRAAIDALKPVHRDLVQLVYWDNLTSEQAAAVLRISPAAARKRLQRAREELQSVIGAVNQLESVN